MKKALLTLAIALAAIAAQAQGTINFQTRIGSIDAKVFQADGTTALAGTGYSIQLFAGPAGAAESALVAVGSPIVGFRTGGAAGYPSVTSTTVTVPGVAPGQRATFQVRAWDNAGGTITSWEAASLKGASTVFSPTAGLGGPDPLGGPPIVTPDLVGLTSFSIPEPSTIALGVLGAAALLLRRRQHSAFGVTARQLPP